MSGWCTYIELRFVPTKQSILKAFWKVLYSIADLELISQFQMIRRDAYLICTATAEALHSRTRFMHFGNMINIELPSHSVVVINQIRHARQYYTIIGEACQ